MPAKTKIPKVESEDPKTTPEKKESPPKQKCKGSTAQKKACGAFPSKNKDHNNDYCAKHQDQAPGHVEKTKTSPEKEKKTDEPASSVLPEESLALLRRLDWNWAGNTPSTDSLTLKTDSKDVVAELTEENWKDLERPMKGVTRVVLVNTFKDQCDLKNVKDTLFFEGEDVSLLDLLNELHKEHKRLEKLYEKAGRDPELPNATFNGKVEVVTVGNNKHYHLVMDKTDFEEEKSQEAEKQEPSKEAPKEVTKPEPPKEAPKTEEPSKEAPKAEEAAAKEAAPADADIVKQPPKRRTKK